MDMMGELMEFVGDNRNREERLAHTVARRAPETAAADRGLPAVSDVSGYWNGSGYVNYFLVGVSLLGGPDVLK